MKSGKAVPVVSRRRALSIGAAVVGGAAVAARTSAEAMAAPRSVDTQGPVGSSSGTAGLPVLQIEKILQASGNVSNGVLQVDINRPDLHVTGGAPRVPFATGFVIQHQFFFQSLGGGKAILNGDLALLPGEIQRVIDTIQANELVFQAFHQHLYDLEPMVWFIHLRGLGDLLALARAARAVVGVTATPLPQPPPSTTTPLPADRLAAILGGDATVGDSGVVTVTVPRTDRIVLGGVQIKPELGVSTTVQFEPLDHGKAAVVPDFSMTAREVNPVTAVMRRQGWQDGCLYNQEIDESPQLYFSHMFKTGNAIDLARQVRRGLDLTNARRPG